MKNTQFIRNFFKLRVCIRLRGFSLPEVTIALLLVSLGASALISNVGSGRLQEVNNARFSAAFRLAAELSDWARLGGLNALAPGPQNPFDLLANAGPVPACFSSPCDARLAALFYLRNWRRRLLLKVPSVRIMICRDSGLINPASYKWACDAGTSANSLRLLKIGWPQSGDGKEFPPRLVLALD